MNDKALLDLDEKLNWHPCSQMKDYATFKPLPVTRAYDSYLELSDGKKIIDAISSWWCKSLGHNHPLLKMALKEQLEKFEHVIFANTTNEIIVQLSQKLTALMPNLNKVFYAGDGSSAVEVALKMSLHTRVVCGETQRRTFIALKNGYHGETTAALSVSDLGIYRDAYTDILFNSIFIDPLYVSGSDDPKWNNASDYWPTIEEKLAPYRDTATAIVLEPIIQGAGGMLVYSQDFLTKIGAWAKQHQVHIIADEIMSGIGRTGAMLACEHAQIQPDFICLAKGLTSGWMPFSAVLTTNDIYQNFYDDYETGKAFLHSHTYSGNALGASLAIATLNIIETTQLCNQANKMQNVMRNYMETIADQTGLIKNIRGIGAVIAADLITNNKNKRLGYQVYQEAVKLGALLRPLGNTIYWVPPLTISDQTLLDLKEITLQAIVQSAAV